MSPLKRTTDFLGFTDFKSKEPTPPTSGQTFNPESAGERKVLYKWTIASHSKTAMDMPKFTKSHMIIGLFVAFILIVMQEFLLIAVIGSLVFLWYVLSSAEPEEVTHEISTHGVDYAGTFYRWDELNEFFISKTGEMNAINIDTKTRLPGRLIMMLKPGDVEKVRELVGRYLTFMEEPPQLFTDNIIKSAAEKMNLGTDGATPSNPEKPNNSDNK